jgi:hypothetical protein
MAKVKSLKQKYMKKAQSISLCLMAFATTVCGQAPTSNKVVLQKITLGAVFASSASTSLSGKIKPMVLGYNLSPNVCFVTNKTYHNVLYGFGNNAGRIVTGYLLKKDLGIYVIAQKSFASSRSYFSLGVEKFVKAGDINFFLFGEVGKNVNPGSELITLGMHANIQTPLWRKK